MDNQKPFQYSNSDADWSDMNQLISNTQKLTLADQYFWNPATSQGQNKNLNGAYSNNYAYGISQPIQKQPNYTNFANPLTLTKSKSDYVYNKEPQYFPQQIQQTPTQYSPYLGPKSKKLPTPVVLKLQVLSKQPVELDYRNIFSAFAKYGELKDVLLEANGSAYVIFFNFVDAQRAEKAMNQQVVSDDARLVVGQCNVLESNYALEKSNQKMLLPRNNSNFQEQSPLISPSLSNNSNSSASYAPKFTCKYEIQIDNDRDFQVARRIIGSKGYNMKRIIQLCQQKANNSINAPQADLLKLRLRGRGSGFKEGPEKKESDEPLHLCISSKDQEVYRMACHLVEELLRSIYKEYIAFCQHVGQMPPEKLEVKCIVPGPNKENPDTQLKDFQQKPIPTQLMSNAYNIPDNRYEQKMPQFSQQNDPKFIEQLIAAFIKARKEFNIMESEKIRNQLKMYGISLFDEVPEKSKAGASSWEPMQSKY